MSAKIKDGFVALSVEREKIARMLNESGDIGVKRLKSWPLFIAACVIAENYNSDVRKILRLDIAAGHLNSAKVELEQYGIPHNDFINLEKALKSVIHTIKQKANIGTYKSSVAELREGHMTPEITPKLNK